MGEHDLENLISANNPNLETAFVQFYDTYQDITQEPNATKYITGEIDYISVPSNLRLNPDVYKIILNRLEKNPYLLGSHTENKHTWDSQLAIQVLKKALEEGEASLYSRIQPDQGKEDEASRICLTLSQEKERITTKHLHLQMAQELAASVQDGSLDNKTLKKNLAKFSLENPAFATLIALELVNLSPIHKNLSMKIDDIFEINNEFSKNRPGDFQYLLGLYNEISGGKIFSIENLEKAISTLSKKYPSEKENLNIISTFSENIKPVIVFESALNILNDEIFPSRDIRTGKTIVSRNPRIFNSFTSRVVTAYIEHKTIKKLGPPKIMLSPETISSYKH